MNTVIAEQGIRCEECQHGISDGSLCLSQMPQEMPKRVQRSEYQNFCIDCEDCNAKVAISGKGLLPCYVRWLDCWYTHPEKTSENVGCIQCSSDIPKGTWAAAQKFYFWPGLEVDTQKKGNSKGAAAGMAAGFSIPNPVEGWERLSPAAQRLFKVKGLRGRGLCRSDAMARRLYESVPKGVRRLGEPAVRKFLNGKDASHIRSVANAPEQARQPGNIVWEKSRLNRARGCRNMTPKEVARANSTARIAGLNVVGRAVAGRAVRSGAITGLTTAPLAGAENFFHWKQGRKSGQQAVKDTVKDVSVSAAIGGATAGVLATAGVVGVGISFGPFGVPLMVIGGAMFAGSRLSRIANAARRDPPLKEHRIFFCEDSDCKRLYAQAATDAAVGLES